MPRRTPALRWLIPALVAVAWLVLAGPLGSFSGRLGEVSENDSAAFLPDSAESTQVTELQRSFQTERTLPVILLWESEDGALDPAALAEAQARVDEAVGIAEDADALEGEPSPAIPSDDGAAVQAVLPFDPDLGDTLGEVIGELRALPAIDGTTAYVTGPGAIFSDFAQ